MRSTHFATLVARHPANELFRFSLAQALLAESRPGDALEHLVECANRKPDWMMPRICWGRLSSDWVEKPRRVRGSKPH